MLGSLATFGYASKVLNVERELENALVANPLALIIDTRLTPYCTWSKFWQRDTLIAQYDTRYLWRGDWLGNINHVRTGAPIQLADERRGVAWLLHSLEAGFTLILLCGCSQYQTCHRKVIYDKVTRQLPLPEYDLNQRVITPCGAGRIDPDVPLDIQRARNRYGVLLDIGNPRKHYFSPHEIENFTVIQRAYSA